MSLRGGATVYCTVITDLPPPFNHRTDRQTDTLTLQDSCSLAHTHEHHRDTLVYCIQHHIDCCWTLTCNSLVGNWPRGLCHSEWSRHLLCHQSYIPHWNSDAREEGEGGEEGEMEREGVEREDGWKDEGGREGERATQNVLSSPFTRIKQQLAIISHPFNFISDTQWQNCYTRCPHMPDLRHTPHWLLPLHTLPRDKLDKRKTNKHFINKNIPPLLPKFSHPS